VVFYFRVILRVYIDLAVGNDQHLFSPYSPTFCLPAGMLNLSALSDCLRPAQVGAFPASLGNSESFAEVMISALRDLALPPLEIPSGE
jgi:hypothetical protein